MRVALTKVDGIEAVDVTLKRGVAHMRLREGNTVTLAQVRRIIKDAGYTSRDASVIAIGRVTSRSDGRSLIVSGTREVFRLEGDPAAPQALTAVPSQDVTAEVQGTVPGPAAADGVETLRVRSVTVRQ